MLKQNLPDPEGRWIALNAANSSPGGLLIQFAARLGAHSIAIVRGRHNFSSLIELGSAKVIDTEPESVCSSVMQHTGGRGVAAAFDAIGGDAGAELASALSPGGAMVHYGLLSGVPLPQGLHARHFWLRNWAYDVDIHSWQQTFQNLFADLRRWRVRLPEVRTYPISQARQ